MQVRKTFRDESRKDYGVDVEQAAGIADSGLQIGCLMRIAAATELMAKPYQGLIDDRDRYKRWYEGREHETHVLRLRLSALRGVITKLKKSQK